MSRALIEIGSCNVDLELRPIEPAWIIEGNPVSRSHILSTSSDGTSSTIIWSCTEGRFNWYYDFDETIMILEGSIVLESQGMPPKRYGPGDVIFFRHGAHAKWHVDGYVKKVAFLRKSDRARFRPPRRQQAQADVLKGLSADGAGDGMAALA